MDPHSGYDTTTLLKNYQLSGGLNTLNENETPIERLNGNETPNQTLNEHRNEQLNETLKENTLNEHTLNEHTLNKHTLNEHTPNKNKTLNEIESTEAFAPN